MGLVSGTKNPTQQDHQKNVFWKDINQVEGYLFKKHFLPSNREDGKVEFPTSGFPTGGKSWGGNPEPSNRSREDGKAKRGKGRADKTKIGVQYFALSLLGEELSPRQLPYFSFEQLYKT